MAPKKATKKATASPSPADGTRRSSRKQTPSAKMSEAIAAATSPSPSKVTKKSATKKSPAKKSPAKSVSPSKATRSSPTRTKSPVKATELSKTKTRPAKDGPASKKQAEPAKKPSPAKKTTSPTSQGADGLEGELTAPKPRGRPKKASPAKDVDADEGAITDGTTASTPQPRGRPRSCGGVRRKGGTESRARVIKCPPRRLKSPAKPPHEDDSSPAKKPRGRPRKASSLKVDEMPEEQGWTDSPAKKHSRRKQGTVEHVQSAFDIDGVVQSIEGGESEKNMKRKARSPARKGAGSHAGSSARNQATNTCRSPSKSREESVVSTRARSRSASPAKKQRKTSKQEETSRTIGSIPEELLDVPDQHAGVIRRQQSPARKSANTTSKAPPRSLSKSIARKQADATSGVPSRSPSKSPAPARISSTKPVTIADKSPDKFGMTRGRASNPRESQGSSRLASRSPSLARTRQQSPAKSNSRGQRNRSVSPIKSQAPALENALRRMATADEQHVHNARRERSLKLQEGRGGYNDRSSGVTEEDRQKSSTSHADIPGVSRSRSPLRPALPNKPESPAKPRSPSKGALHRVSAGNPRPKSPQPSPVKSQGEPARDQPSAPGRGPVRSIVNQYYLPGSGRKDEEQKVNPFYETMPGPEVWHRRMPPYFPFGETPYMEREMSRQISEDLARGNEQPEAKPARRRSIVQLAIDSARGIGSRIMGTPSPAPEPHAKKYTSPWELPEVTDEQVESGMKDFMPSLEAATKATKAGTRGPPATLAGYKRKASSAGQSGSSKRYEMSGALPEDEDDLPH